MSVAPDNREIYDAHWGEWLDLKVHGAASRWLRFLISTQLAALRRCTRITSVLDVGCGEGTITDMLAAAVPDADVSGIDLSEAGVGFARQRYQRPNLHFLHDPASDRLDTPHDLVTAFEVLEHVDDWKSLLARMAGAANWLLLSFPTGRMRRFEVQVGHHRNFARGEVESFLAAHGFEPVRVLYAGFPFYSPLYREFCNLTNSSSNAFTRGTFGPAQKLAALLIYALFRFGSTRKHWGDQFCGLFVRS